MKFARCNFDGNPISPDDKPIVGTFLIWLQMDRQDRYWAVKLDPEWRRFTGITLGMVKDHG